MKFWTWHWDVRRTAGQVVGFALIALFLCGAWTGILKAADLALHALGWH